jgi:hypothetical protein
MRVYSFVFLRVTSWINPAQPFHVVPTLDKSGGSEQSDSST